MRKNKIFSLLLSFVMLFSLAVPSYATDINTAGSIGNSTVVLTAAASSFSVTVPTALPIYMAADGVITCANSGVTKITNNSYGPVKITGASIDTSATDWSLVAFTSNFNILNVGSHKFGMQLQGSNVDTNGSCSVENFGVINGGGYITLTYDGNVAPQIAAINDSIIANVIFTVDWFTGADNTTNPDPDPVDPVDPTPNPNTDGINLGWNVTSTRMPKLTWDAQDFGSDVSQIRITTGGANSSPRATATKTSTGSNNLMSMIAQSVDLNSSSQVITLNVYAVKTDSSTELLDSATINITRDGSASTSLGEPVYMDGGDYSDYLSTPVTDGNTFYFVKGSNNGNSTVANISQAFNSKISSQFSENPVNGATVTAAAITNSSANGNTWNITIAASDTATYTTGGTTPVDPTPSTVTFSIGGTEYTAASGSTVAEWVGSAYNTAGFSLNNSNQLINSSGNEIQNGGVTLLGTSNITSGASYTIKANDPTPSTVTFSIGGTEYTAASGSTVAEWVASAYNTAGFALNTNNSLINSSGYEIQYYGTTLYGTNIITSGASYTIKTTISLTVNNSSKTAAVGTTLYNYLNDNYDNVSVDDGYVTVAGKAVKVNWNKEPSTYVLLDGDTIDFPIDNPSPSTSTITFSIGGVEYTAASGSTVAEWVASAYNTAGFSLNGSSQLIDSSGNEIQNGGVTLLGTSTITSGASYTIDIAAPVDPTPSTSLKSFYIDGTKYDYDNSQWGMWVDSGYNTAGFKTMNESGPNGSIIYYWVATSNNEGLVDSSGNTITYSDSIVENANYYSLIKFDGYYWAYNESTISEWLTSGFYGSDSYKLDNNNHLYSKHDGVLIYFDEGHTQHVTGSHVISSSDTFYCDVMSKTSYFYIDGVQMSCYNNDSYTATLAEWVRSDYNTYGYKINGSGYVTTADDVVLKTYDQASVLATSVIGNRYYTTAATISISSGGAEKVYSIGFGSSISSWVHSEYNTDGFYLDNGILKSSSGITVYDQYYSMLEDDGVFEGANGHEVTGNTVPSEYSNYYVLNFE